MGRAKVELIGNYIVEAVNDNKNLLGNKYDDVKKIIADSTWKPDSVEEMMEGMIDCLNIMYPDENIKKIDLKILNSIGDWSYGCRSHTCWGRYVNDPVKTLSSRRLDYPLPFKSAYHHILYAYSPDDKTPRYVSFAWPGTVVAITGVNEYGTLVSLHDYQSYETDFSCGCMPRMVACNYALTYVNSDNLSKHLNSIFNELQNYEVMTASFVNYYTPMGYGGVITCNPNTEGSDFYHLRRPNTSWHHGEAMITTNTWTDGSYTPIDEDFNADEYYNDETPKTLESHWNLLDLPGYGNWLNAHLFSVEYRNKEDMTILAEGKLNLFGKRTPRLKYEWDELFDLKKPTNPKLNGPAKLKKNTEYTFTIESYDPNNDKIYYYLDWGDNTNTGWKGPFSSGSIEEFTHSWDDEKEYLIKAKSKDETGLESNWSTLKITTPKNKPIFRTIFDRLESFFNFR